MHILYTPPKIPSTFEQKQLHQNSYSRQLQREQPALPNHI